MVWKNNQNLEILKNLNLDDKANAYSRSLSGGMKRRLMVAKAMVHRPPIIILDEPTSSLDKITEKNILEILSTISKECSVVVITHNLDNTQYCDRIMKIDNKEIKISNK